MHSQKITRSAARHLRRKRMNLARKAEKLSDSSEGSLIINKSNQKTVKDNINKHIIETLDAKDMPNKPSTKNKNFTKNEPNNRNKIDNLNESKSSSNVDNTHNQINVDKKVTKGKQETQETKLETLKTLKKCCKSDQKVTEEKQDTRETKLETPKSLEECRKSDTKSKKNLGEMPEMQKKSNKECTKTSVKSTEVVIQCQGGKKIESLNVSKCENNDKIEEAKQKSTEGKSKSQLRAERRAIQEKQRALKAQMKEKQAAEKVQGKKIVEAPKTETKIAQPVKLEVPPNASSSVTTPMKDECEKKVEKKVIEHHIMGVFDHLEHDKSQVRASLNSEMNPIIVKLGVKYAKGKANGSDCCCVALLLTLKRFIKDFEKSEQQDFVRALEEELNKTVDYLNGCRPLSVTMQNALKRIRWQMSLFKTNETDENVKTILRESIDTYIREQILLAGEAISRRMQNRISDGDVILTYGYSSLVQKILCDAQEKGKKFRVILVDSRPKLEGKSMLKTLVKENVNCTYVMISALSFVMPQVSFVLLGAHAILANGAIMAKIGTAQIALMGKDLNVPILVASELNKFADDIALTDSFVYNELDKNDDLSITFDDTKKSPLVNWKSRKILNQLNLTYDVTPPSLITSVITELSIIPCSSIPVVLRVKPWEV